MVRRLVARCSDPAYTAEIKSQSDWGAYCKSLPQKGLKPFIVDEETGATLLPPGKGSPTAIAKFFREMGEVSAPNPEPSNRSPVETPDGETLFPLEVYLPSEIFSLYNHALGAGYTDQADIVGFLVEYAEWGFMHKHGMVLTLAPVDEFQPTDGADGQIDARLEALERNMALIAGALNRQAYPEDDNRGRGRESEGGEESG